MATATKKMTMTGWCLQGCHEGTKPVNYLGEPLPVCVNWEWCKCECHKQITEMYEIAGLPREVHPNPDYQPKPRTFWMPGDPDPMPEEVLSNPDGTTTQPEHEGTVTVPLRAAPTPSFDPTPTGRKARGQLEQEVLEVCAEFAAGVYDWQYCTPKLVAERIAIKAQAEAPSTGAINSVWDRWEKLGIAVQAKKPSRFIRFEESFTPAWPHLLKVKADAKRKKRRMISEQRRGYRG